ncbi:hypothetical protein [Herbaspirillum rhizosphaerae]|uniref:hypothetical protein n=1 Tax=Herbaspirillum rhizosphaerae TaxID=346179 RepID=UPI0012EE930B|nr:hypothetical protein [Herbaspirillum rhizosphaerae]
MTSGLAIWKKKCPQKATFSVDLKTFNAVGEIFLHEEMPEKQADSASSSSGSEE